MVVECEKDRRKKGDRGDDNFSDRENLRVARGRIQQQATNEGGGVEGGVSQKNGCRRRGMDNPFRMGLDGGAA